jgi:hypothetical protein
MKRVSQFPGVAQADGQETMATMAHDEIAGPLVISALFIESVKEVKDGGRFRFPGLQHIFDPCDAQDGIEVRQEWNENDSAHLQNRWKQTLGGRAEIQDGTLRSCH